MEGRRKEWSGEGKEREKGREGGKGGQDVEGSIVNYDSLVFTENDVDLSSILSFSVEP